MYGALFPLSNQPPKTNQMFYNSITTQTLQIKKTTAKRFTNLPKLAEPGSAETGFLVQAVSFAVLLIIYSLPFPVEFTPLA